MTTGNNYPNPLDNFRSYSYHFVMAAASTTEAFRKMIEADKNGNGAVIGAALSAKLFESFKVGDKEAWLVVDTRRFSQYSITDLEMEHVYGTGSRINPTVPSNTTRMTLIDTTGLTFFNSMMDLLRNKLKTTKASAFFLLSIIFVGHRDDGTTETISTCHIPLTLLLMSFEFTSSGSIFDIEFMELEGAPQNSPAMEHINSLGSISSVSTEGKANELGEILQVLEDRLNVQSLQGFQKFQNETLQKGTSKTKLGKLVQYMITIPDEWKRFSITSAPRSKNIESKYLVTTQGGIRAAEAAAEAAANAPRTFITTQGGIRAEEARAAEEAKIAVDTGQIQSDSRYSQVSFSNTMTITDAIKSILESSKNFTDLQSKEKRDTGEAVSFKTVTSITSDDASYVVHFDIYPYHIPKIGGTSDTIPSGARGHSVSGNTIVKNLITYDYIFSGKNSHIKNLKIKYDPVSAIALDTNIELGGNRFAKVAASGQEMQKSQDIKSGAAKSSAEIPQLRPGDPIFFPMKTVDQKNNLSSQKTEELGADESREITKSKQEYSQTMASLHFLSSMVLDVDVRGNPNIIRKFADKATRYGVAPHHSIVSTDQVNSFDLQNQSEASNNFFTTVKGGLSSAKEKYINEYIKPRINSYNKGMKGDDDLLNGIDVSVLPVFVKLNIFAPNVDWVGDFTDSNNLFTDSFFFNGVYQLLTVKTTFNNAEFSHSMVMIPYDSTGEYSTSKDGNSSATK